MASAQPRRPTGPFIYLSVLLGFGVAMMVVKPFWEKASYNSLRAECAVNLEVVADAQAEWIKANGRPLVCAAHPPDPVPEAGHLWEDPPLCWTQLGFETGLTLHGRYEVEGSATSWTARCTVQVGDEVEVWEASNERTSHRVGG